MSDQRLVDEDVDTKLIIKYEEPYRLLINLEDKPRVDLQEVVQELEQESHLLNLVDEESEDNDTDHVQTTSQKKSKTSSVDSSSNKDCRKKGTAIRSKEREVIRTIIDFCDQEAKQKCLMFPLRQATKRAAQYAKISERTVKRIREESKMGVEFTDKDRSSSGKVRRLKMAHKFCSNLSFMFQEAPSILERYQLAKDAGFKAVESGFPVGFTVEQVTEAKKKANIQQALINVYTGDTSKGELGFAAIPGKEEEFKNSIERTIEYAKALDCKKIHVMAGKVENPTSANDTTYENNLRYAAERFASENIVGLIEPINSITIPNYYMNNFQKALTVIKKINSSNLKLLVDIFHLQLSQGKITKTIENCHSYIGHVQIAQVPDRNEPDTVGEIDYKYIFSLLEKNGYNDFIGLEYKPLAGTVEGLKWVNHFGYTL